ncbi:MAG TPA: 30S ribosomal protein S5 [Candidatus Nanoarchaeia archaeon]|nr:30S ribosomal protein S5 [Candidatus Nanoarchaeia archaeon]
MTAEQPKKETAEIKEEAKEETLAITSVLTAPEEPGEEMVKAPPTHLESWNPKTDLGMKVKRGEIRSISEILDNGKKIMEPQIVDALMPNAETDLLLMGQAKGKFGGGQRRAFKQTQKKTMEGNKPKFSTCAIIGNKNGIIGAGFGKAKETIPAREKAITNSKLNIIKIRRGCGSWECGCKTPHSIPFAVEAKSGSVIIRIMPAPKGQGLCIQKECKKILALAGIRDVYSKTYGKTKTRTNLVLACMAALRQLMAVKMKPQEVEATGMIEGETGEIRNDK